MRQWVCIGLDNGLAPNRRQAIIWTNARILPILPLRTNFDEFLIKKYKPFHSRKCIWKYRLQNDSHFVRGRWVNGVFLTVRCGYNAVQYNMVFHSPLHWLTQTTNQSLDLKNTLFVLPSRASYGVLIVKIWERIGRVKMAPHWTCKSVLHDFIPESRLILAVWNWVDEVASLFQNIKLFTWHTWPLRSHQRSTECNRRGLGIPMVSKRPLTIKCSHLRDRQS